jgi:glyoxylase-like metal-dependent hydrolase (beta-lactamase superfamily II)
VVIWTIAFIGAAFPAFNSWKAYATATQVKTDAPAFYRFMLGNFEITALSDGTALRQLDEIMSKPDEVRAVFARDHQALPAPVAINTFLINTGSKLVLIDTGAGELFGPRSGRMVSNLRASGYQPEQIDAVLLTHTHPDHAGGLSIGGRRVFPGAVVYVDKRDPDYWLSDAAENAAPDNRKQMFHQAHATIDPYVKAGMLHPFDGATELFPGIRTVPAYGHTRGHSGYMVESQGKQLLLWGDIAHSVEVQFADPDVTIEFDQNTDDAIASRKRALAEAAERGYLVGGAHISFPGLGHVSFDGKSYRWITLPYSAIQ